MSGTSAGARRGWKTRKGQLPSVTAGRNKSPIRQAAGKKADYTRKLHQRNREGAARIQNMEQKMFTRLLVRGHDDRGTKVTQEMADNYYRQNQREYERQLRMNPVRHRKRGRK